MSESQSCKRNLVCDEEKFPVADSSPSKILKNNSKITHEIGLHNKSVKGIEGAAHQEESCISGNQTCSYYILRKKRYCKMLVAKSRKFCGQHLTEDSENKGVYKRIPCPLDPNHTCFENKLASHLAICNARERTDQPFRVKGINEGEEDVEESINSSNPLKHLTDEELFSYIKRIEKVFDEHIDPLEIRIRDHPALKDSLSRPEIGHSVIRHLKQNSSLISLLEDNDLLNGSKNEVFVEFGAGRGKLTGWIIEAIQKKDPLFILIDKGSQRYKIDSKLKHENNLKIKRLKIDIQDLDLDKVEGIDDNSKIVACGKHLCGAATDFSLRCITNFQRGTTSGIVIALCCHHRCTWKAYVGKKFFKKIGFGRNDFTLMVSLSSWAVSGSRLSSTNKKLMNMVEKSPPELTVNENRYKRMELSISDREIVGRKVKALIDKGRIEYLNENRNDIKATLVQYVEQTSTLENVALIAHKVQS